MSQRGDRNVKLNILQRARLKIQNIRLDRKLKRIKKVHNVDLSETDNIKVVEKFASKKEYKNYVKDIQKVLGRNNFNFKKLKSGASIKKDTEIKIREVVEGINKSYSDRKISIIKNARENLSEEVADMIERDIEELDKKKRTRMLGGDFADLLEVDADKIVDSIIDEEDAVTKLEALTGDFYDLNKRDLQYRDNYVKAILNEYGDTSETQELVGLIMELEIEEFMLGYYNPYSNTQIKDIYDPEQIDDYVQYLKVFYDRTIGANVG